MIAYFFAQATHQPLGLIDPETIWQEPFALAFFPLTKNRQPLHFCVPFG